MVKTGEEINCLVLVFDLVMTEAIACKIGDNLDFVVAGGGEELEASLVPQKV